MYVNKIITNAAKQQTNWDGEVKEWMCNFRGAIGKSLFGEIHLILAQIAKWKDEPKCGKIWGKYPQIGTCSAYWRAEGTSLVHEETGTEMQFSSLTLQHHQTEPSTQQLSDFHSQKTHHVAVIRLVFLTEQLYCFCLKKIRVVQKSNKEKKISAHVPLRKCKSAIFLVFFPVELWLNEY